MKHRFTTKQILFACFSFAFVGMLSFLLVKNMHTTDATMNGFRAGNIISDYVMSNYNTMNESQIQTFLNSKNSCNKSISGGSHVGTGNDYGVTYNYAANYSGKNYHYHNNNNKYICIGSERFNSQSAAHIIYRAAQDYHINPQVLLVLLQKEQSLITDQWPNTNFQYRSATGYGCPDTEPCNSEYYGFKNQVRKAAELFRIVLDNDYNPYHSGRTAYVQYNPNASCGGSNVYIENRATAALYRYTPYQPGGSGSCAAYGNRNFYDYFTDWFGDTRGNGISGRTASISDGTYKIVSKKNLNQTLDIAGGVNATGNGTNIQLWSDLDIASQEWTIKYDNNTGYYNILNANSGNKALDVSGAGYSDGTNIQLFDYNNTCAQQWKAIYTPDGYFTFVSACSSKVLDLSGGNANNGTNIQVFGANNSDAQKWALRSVKTIDDGIYTIKSKTNNNQILDIAGGVNATNNGTNIQLWDNLNIASQNWKISYDDSGNFYRIQNPASNKVLDASNAGTINGTNIQIWSLNKNTCAQKWNIIKTTDNNYTINSTCSDKVLDIAGGKIRNGTNLQLFTANNTNAQKWKIEASDHSVSDGTYTISYKKDSNKVLDIAGGVNATNNGTNIQIWDNLSIASQIWNINYDKDSGFYRIQNPASNKVLDVAGGGSNNGTNIQIWSLNKNTCAQKWNIIKNGSHYIFTSACSGKALDVSGGSTKNGANIQLFTNNNSEAQKWNLNKLQ